MSEMFNYDISDDCISDGNEIHYNGSYYNNDDENIVFKLCSDGLFLHFYNTDENPLSVIHYNLPECHVMREVFGFDMSVLSSIDAEALIDIVGGKRYYNVRSWLQDGQWVIKKNPYNPTVIAWKYPTEPYQPKGE